MNEDLYTSVLNGFADGIFTESEMDEMIEAIDIYNEAKLNLPKIKKPNIKVPSVTLPKPSMPHPIKNAKDKKAAIAKEESENAIAMKEIADAVSAENDKIEVLSSQFKETMDNIKNLVKERDIDVGPQVRIGKNILNTMEQCVDRLDKLCDKAEKYNVNIDAQLKKAVSVGNRRIIGYLMSIIVAGGIIGTAAVYNAKSISKYNEDDKRVLINHLEDPDNSDLDYSDNMGPVWRKRGIEKMKVAGIGAGAVAAGMAGIGLTKAVVKKMQDKLKLSTEQILLQSKDTRSKKKMISAMKNNIRDAREVLSIYEKEISQ